MINTQIYYYVHTIYIYIPAFLQDLAICYCVIITYFVLIFVQPTYHCSFQQLYYSYILTLPVLAAAPDRPSLFLITLHLYIITVIYMTTYNIFHQIPIVYHYFSSNYICIYSALTYFPFVYMDSIYGNFQQTFILSFFKLTCPRCSSRQTFYLFSIDSISLNYVSNLLHYYTSQRFLYIYFLLVYVIMCLLCVFKQTSLFHLLCNLPFYFIFPHLSSLQLQTSLFLFICPINCTHVCTCSYYLLIVIHNVLKVLINYLHTY